MEIGHVGSCVGPAALMARSVPEPLWSPSATSIGTSDQAYAECRYDASLATANPSLQSTPKSMDDAISSGVAAGIEDAELIVQRMRARLSVGLTGAPGPRRKT